MDEAEFERRLQKLDVVQDAANTLDGQSARLQTDYHQRVAALCAEYDRSIVTRHKDALESCAFEDDLGCVYRFSSIDPDARLATKTWIEHTDPVSVEIVEDRDDGNYSLASIIAQNLFEAQNGDFGVKIVSLEVFDAHLDRAVQTLYRSSKMQ